MEPIGNVGNRAIYYTPTNNKEELRLFLPEQNWVAFTVIDVFDEKQITNLVEACLKQQVSYICCAGNQAYLTEDYFDEIMVWSMIEQGIALEEQDLPMTTAHADLEEGFWFAAVVADDDVYEIDTVVCLDATERRLKSKFIALIRNINDNHC